MPTHAHTVLHLAPCGNDSASGSHEQPMLSIPAAIRRLERLDAQGLLRLPAEIVLHQGTYRLTQTLDLTTTFPLAIHGADGETAILDGGLELNDWEPVSVNGRNAYRTHVPIPVLQLYCDGKTLTRAAFPKAGAFHRVRDTKPDGAGLFSGKQTFLAEHGSFNPDWHNPTGIETLLIHKWIEEHLPVADFDPQTDTVRSTHRSTFLIDQHDTEYRFENVREALLEPGEFYYDCQDSTVTIIPPADADAPHATAPLLGPLVRLLNARFLTLSNLTFRHAGAYRPRCTRRYDFHDLELTNFAPQNAWLDENSPLPFAAAPQAAVQVPGILFLHQSSHCDIDHCTFTAADWYGLEVSAGCSNIRIEHNHFHDLGAGGVRIGGASIHDDPTLATSRVSVLNNHIHHVGLTYLSAVGILITHAFGNLVEHNHIHDLSYSGISIGWNWGFNDSITRENRIGWNHIHHLGNGVLSDMGGIYLLGLQPGTRVYSNLIHHVTRRYYGGWGIYTDEGSSHIVVEYNLVHDCSSEAYHQHFGRENTLRYNVFAFGGDAVLALSRGQEHDNLFPGENFSNALASYNNVFISNGTPFLRAGSLRHLTLPTFLAENSLFLNASDNPTLPPIAAAGNDTLNLDQWQERGFDRAALIDDDPGFASLANRDFTLRDDALLNRLHFQLPTLSQVGVQPEP